jgi:flagellar hook-associated protein 3 FlgL
MRVSTTFQHQLSVNAMLDQHAKLTQTQLKLSSGKNI